MRAALLNTVLIIALFYTSDVRDDQVENILKMLRLELDNQHQQEKTSKRKKSPKPNENAELKSAHNKLVEDRRTWTATVNLLFFCH